MLSEAAAVFNLVDKAQSWLTRAVQASGDKKREGAAHVLAAAGVLVGALHALMSAYKSLLAPLTLFELTWQPDRREAAVEALYGFVMQERLFPLIQQKVSELKELQTKVSSEDTEFVQLLIAYGQTVLDNLEVNDLIQPAWPNNRSLRGFLRSVRDAESVEDANAVTAAAETGLEAVISMSRSEADIGYGRLRARLLNQFPDLLAPDWDADLAKTVAKKV